MNLTPIEWTTFSANPLKYRDAAGQVVWGCVHASPGCQKCYSEALAKRYGRGGPFNVQTMAGLTPFLDDAECHKMRTAKQIGGVAVSGSCCFIGDMTDIFGEWVSDDLLNRLFSNVLEVRTDVTWQILTKRAARMRDYLSWRWGEGRIPSRHIHVGVSVENQHFADARIPLLLQTPAAVRFISAEPLLGPVDLTHIYIAERHYQKDALRRSDLEPPLVPDAKLDWVIDGAESGSGARDYRLDWSLSLQRQCEAAGVAYFRKQIGQRPIVSDLTHWHAPATLLPDASGYRLTLRDKKGGCMSEWPEDLRVRQVPPDAEGAR